MHESPTTQEELPAPADLCRLEGIEGVYYRWRTDSTATVALWGPGANEAARQFADDLLPGEGKSLRRPAFGGDNPWPDLPPFPPSQANPGLAAVSRLERLSPALRVEGMAVVAGQDAEGHQVGFSRPDLEDLRTLRVLGRTAEPVVVNMARQAVQAGIPVLLLDGSGTVVSKLAQILLREMAAGRLLLCDVDRPAQSRFRLNPLWLPADGADSWPDILAAVMAWLRELGVTPAGLGRTAYRHTRVAVVLAALVAAGQGLALDVPFLRRTLAEPDFLAMLDGETLPDGGRLLDTETWNWWLNEGRGTQSFDVRHRLGHLQGRLEALLELPEYELLWQGPYLDPLAVAGGVSLFWRLTDPKRRLRPYISSQLLAIDTLLRVWPATHPLLIFVHELNIGQIWVERFRALPAARLVLAAERMSSLPAMAEPTTLLISRLWKEDAA
ncbi:MAG: hypothetical protein GY824_29725, partial [Delftia sp.]|nr:hypothetical protein [Delftia sp.]